MKQAEKTYLISDAAKRVQVESHVLRYWEEELKLPIKRNEMGHRYYTEDDIRRFQESCSDRSAFAAPQFRPLSAFFAG